MTFPYQTKNFWVSLVKPIVVFLYFLLLITALYSKGLIGNYLKLFNKGWHMEFIEAFSKGHEQTNQYFIASTSDFSEQNDPYRNKYVLLGAGLPDDPGMYYFIPALQSAFHIKTVSAYWILMCSIVVASYSVVVIGIYLLFTNHYVRIASYFYLGLFALFCLLILDMHILPYFITSFIPLLLWIRKKYTRDLKIFLPIGTMILVGLLIGVANQFRFQAGTGMALIIGGYISLDKKIRVPHKLIFIGFLLLSMPACQVYLSEKFQERDNWLQAHSVNQECKKAAHPFWHQLYIGLGFTRNKYGIEYDDQCGFRKASATDPLNNMMSLSTRDITRYEKIIKDAYLQIVREDILFVAKTYFIKFLYILVFALLFFNYGFILLGKVKLTYRGAIPMTLGILYSVLPGILTFPVPFYFLGGLNLLVISELLLLEKYYTKSPQNNYL